MDIINSEIHMLIKVMLFVCIDIIIVFITKKMSYKDTDIRLFNTFALYKLLKNYYVTRFIPIS